MQVAETGSEAGNGAATQVLTSTWYRKNYTPGTPPDLSSGPGLSALRSHTEIKVLAMAPLSSPDLQPVDGEPRRRTEGARVDTLSRVNIKSQKNTIRKRCIEHG